MISLNMKQNHDIFNREGKPSELKLHSVIPAKTKTARDFKLYATKQNPDK